MLLADVRDEFSFHCQCRKLSPRTIKNYTKEIDYLLRFLQQEKQTTHIEDVETKHIKEVLLVMSKAGRTANYALAASSTGASSTTVSNAGGPTITLVLS